MKELESALVLEGGGDRDIFTSGALDCFQDNELSFPYIVGVSAGAHNAMSFLAHQKGRQKQVFIDLNTKYQYTSWKMRILKGNYLNDELLFDTIPNQYIPFDYTQFFENKTICEIVVSNCITGKSDYYSETKSRKNLQDLMRATSRLPFLTPILHYKNQPYLDGGITNPIPLQRAFDLGYTHKPIVILTQDKNYKKSKVNFKLAKLYYRKYPAIYRALAKRYKIYNQQVEWIQQLEKKDSIIVIRPKEPIKLARLNNSKDALQSVYKAGYEAAQKQLPFILKDSTLL